MRHPPTQQQYLSTMLESNTFVFSLDQFTAAGKALLAYAERHPARFALSSVAIAAGLVTIIVPLALGFGGVGPVAGEFLYPYCTGGVRG